MGKDGRGAAAWLDVALVVGLGLASAALLWFVDLGGLVTGTTGPARGLDLTEALILLTLALVAFMYYALRRWQDLRDEARRRGHAEAVLTEASQLVSALVGAQRQLAQPEVDVEGFLRTAVEHAQRICGADGATMEELHGEQTVLRVATGSMADFAGRRIAVAASPAGPALLNGETRLFKEAASHAPRTVGGGPAYASLVAVPMRMEETILGALVVVATRPDAFRTTDAAALTPVAEFMAYTLWNAHEFKSKAALVDEHRQLRAQVEAHEAARQALTSRLNTMYYEMSLPGRVFTFVSTASRRLLGLEPEALIRDPQRWMEAVAAEDRERVAAARATSPLKDIDVTYRVTAPDGRTLRVRERTYRLQGASGRPETVAGLVSETSG